MIPGLNLARIPVLPVIQQSEAGECGLACLAMIANYYGHKVDLNGLRQRFPLSMTGTSLKTLTRIADDLQLAGRAVRLEPEQLNQLQTPAVLHWDLNHFVVLKRADRRKVQIHDPGKGARTYSLQEISPHFTGVALELSPAANFERQNIVVETRLRQLWSGVTGWKRAFLQLVVLSSILLLVTLVTPLYLQLAVDEAVLKFDSHLLLVLALAFGAVYVIGAAAELLRAWAILYFGNMMSFQIVGNLFRHLVRLPTSYFEKRHVGDLISRMGSTQPIQQVLTQGIVSAIIDGIIALFMAAIMLLYSPYLALVVFISVALYVVATVTLYPRMRDRQEEELVTRAREQTHLMESIRASKLVKLFGLESAREVTWRNLYADSIAAGVSAGKYQALMAFFRTAFFGLQIVFVVYFAGRMTLNENFTIGMIFAFAAYAQEFSRRIDTFITEAVQFRLLDLHLRRLGDIVQAEREQEATIPRSAEITGRIEANDLRFRYGVGDPWVIDGIDLHIDPKEFVVITGPSGAGKSTLLKLLLGLYLPNEGKICVDGLPVETFGRRAWREQIGVVMQDDALLSGTIANNIALFDPEIDMERVRAAANCARIHDDVMRLPMNYLSLVGDMGSTLSGGQRQRVLLARALYRDPKILFLDEGTANLDPAMQRDIANVISAMTITRVVIAHSGVLTALADRVYELRNGKLRSVSVESVALGDDRIGLLRASWTE